MKNSLEPKVYDCKCGARTKYYVWSSELKDMKINCIECSAELGVEDITKVEQSAAIRTPTKNR